MESNTFPVAVSLRARAKGFALLAVLVLLSPPLEAADVASPGLSLEACLSRAFEKSPALRAQKAQVREAEADLIEARTYPFNPEIAAELGDRDGETASSTDKLFAVEQEIYVGGQRGKRKAVAQATLEAAQSQFQWERMILASQVQMAFSETLRSREIRRVARLDVELTRNLLAFAERRLEAGAGTQVELNLARSTAGRTEWALRSAEADYLAARHRLGEVIGQSPESAPEAAGDLPMPTTELSPLALLLESALRSRADLIGLRLETEASRQQIRFAKSLAVPNIRLGAYYAEEEGTDEIIGGGVRIALPLFQRNQGGVAMAEAKTDRLEATTSAAELEVRRQVADEYTRYQAASESAQALQSSVIGQLEENLEFLQRALQAGKIGAAEVLVFRREFIAGEREYIEALFQASASQIALDLATGRTDVPELSNEENSN